MQIITVITQAMDMARRRFTRGEQSMLIDIFNGNILSPALLGQHLVGEVEDSFQLYPGKYEEKWGVKKDEMMEKIRALSPSEAIFLELWAIGFWAINTSAHRELEGYLSGKLNLAGYIESIIKQIDSVCARLESTKSAFKSAAVAAARAEAEKAKEALEGML